MRTSRSFPQEIGESLENWPYETGPKAFTHPRFFELIGHGSGHHPLFVVHHMFVGVLGPIIEPHGLKAKFCQYLHDVYLLTEGGVIEQVLICLLRWRCRGFFSRRPRGSLSFLRKIISSAMWDPLNVADAHLLPSDEILPGG